MTPQPHKRQPAGSAKPGSARREGSTLVVVVVVCALVLVGVGALLQRVASSRSAVQARNNKLLANNLAEAGLARGLEILEKVSSPTDPVYHEPDFHDFDDQSFSDFVELTFLALANGPEDRRFSSLRSPNDGEYRVAALERTPGEDGVVYTIRAEGVYRGPSQRSYQSVVEADVQFVFDSERFGGAIVSDAPNLNATPGGGKPRARDGNIVLGKGKGFLAVMGRMAANGSILDGKGEALNAGNIASVAHVAHPAKLSGDLYNTAEEIPDHTLPGQRKQLFDFGRFIAAADLGAGVHFASLEEFAAAAEAGQTFEGIVVVDVNPADYARTETGSGKIVIDDPRLTDKPGQAHQPATHYVPSIEIAGTLVLNVPPTFEHGGSEYQTPDVYTVEIDAPLNINPAPADKVADYVRDVEDYSALVEAGTPPPLPPTPPAGQAPYGSEGYGLSNPWEVPLASMGFVDFQPGDDLPALMLSLGVLDIDAAANISGAIFAPSFAEIENKHDATQYFAGALFAGGGVYVQDFGNSGRLAIAYRQPSVDRLATDGLAFKAPAMIAWRQIR